MVTKLRNLKKTTLPGSVEDKIIKDKKPMLICERDTGSIRYANNAAVGAYDYTKKEFSELCMPDIFHHKFECKELSYVFLTKDGFRKTGKRVHEDKIGNTFNIKLSILPMMYQSKDSALIKVKIVK